MAVIKKERQRNEDKKRKRKIKRDFKKIHGDESPYVFEQFRAPSILYGYLDSLVVHSGSSGLDFEPRSNL